jgi:hypothetical protein
MFYLKCRLSELILKTAAEKGAPELGWGSPSICTKIPLLSLNTVKPSDSLVAVSRLAYPVRKDFSVGKRESMGASHLCNKHKYLVEK